eukprot:TRINITY_DN7648_c0_g1_i1.p2 TRINITY_DN7648_c0_g1~~TRINITY_DN7648_c0_g1_i1.p2  ORF type:complete len:164 (+),score=62.96 TRINITY_DN7648_c0_g1_i1:408-899(+)
MEPLPTPKAFRDAIESLSPEQQRFAKALRAMQLEGTLFGICVLQIKPQLERLLRLQPDALTKEIALTQSLLELFIKYQVPSDLLTAHSEGEPAPPAAEALARVRNQAAALTAMIDDARKAELRDADERMKKEEAEHKRQAYEQGIATPCMLDERPHDDLRFRP